MEKPASLRLVLEQALPELAQNPEKLSMFVDGAQIISTGVRNLSHEFVYPLVIMIDEFSGEIGHLTTPIVNWLMIHQPDMFNNLDKRNNDFKINVTYKDNQRQDIDIRLNLSERLYVHDNDAGERVYQYVPEPGIPE